MVKHFLNITLGLVCIIILSNRGKVTVEAPEGLELQCRCAV